MNKTIFLTTAAALATAFIQPVQAKPHDRDGQGGGKGKAAAHVQKSQPAPKQKFQASAPKMKSPAAPKQFAQHSQHMQKLAGKSGRSELAGNDRKFRASQRQQPTIAMGGSSAGQNERNLNLQQRNERNVERNTVVQNNRSFSNRNVQNFTRNDYRSYRPPSYVFRDWDRHNVHVWNNHRYRWYNNDWIIIDAGYAPSFYYDYDYDYGPAPVAEIRIGDNTALSVQRELSRLGYHPGVIDGVVGPQTRSAIAAFQEDRGLPVTGRIDRPLLREMDL